MRGRPRVLLWQITLVLVVGIAVFHPMDAPGVEQHALAERGFP